MRVWGGMCGGVRVCHMYVLKSHVGHTVDSADLHLNAPRARQVAALRCLRALHAPTRGQPDSVIEDLVTLVLGVLSLTRPPCGSPREVALMQVSGCCLPCSQTAMCWD